MNMERHRFASSSFISNPSAFIFQNDELTDLNELSIGGDDFTHLIAAYGISNNGYIVGKGLIDGEVRAFLLSPVPVPATVWLFVSALISLAGIKCRYS